MLMASVVAALASGLLCSWIACQWAWRDDWNGWSISSLLFTIALGLASVYFSAPTGLNLVHGLQWALAGPLNVIATQGVVVLAVLAVWRCEHELSSNSGKFVQHRAQQAAEVPWQKAIEVQR